MLKLKKLQKEHLRNGNCIFMANNNKTIPTIQAIIDITLTPRDKIIPAYTIRDIKMKLTTDTTIKYVCVFREKIKPEKLPSKDKIIALLITLFAFFRLLSISINN